MIGMAHEHFTSAIKVMWDVVALNLNTWRGIFADGIEQDTDEKNTEWAKRIDEVHKGLTRPLLTGKRTYSGKPTDYVAIGLANLLARTNNAPPGVFAHISNSTPLITADGSVPGTTYGHYRNRVEVVVIGITEDEMAMLAGFAHAAIVTRRGYMFEHTSIAQISLPTYEEIGPMADLLPDHGSAYWCRLIYNVGEDVTGRVIPYGKPPTRATKVEVHDERAFGAPAPGRPGGYPGRVRPRMRTS